MVNSLSKKTSFFYTSILYITGLAILFPIIWLIISSFRPQHEIVGSPYSLPQEMSVNNFIELVNIPGFTASLINSFSVAILTTFICAVAAIPTGYLLARYSFSGRSFLRAFALSGYLFAPAVLALPYFKIFGLMELIDSLFGIALSHTAFCLPFAVTISDLIFRSVPYSLEEVSMLDGHGFFSRLIRIVIPAAMYQVASLLILIFIISWKEFYFAFLISSGVDTRTLPVLLATLYGGEALNWHLVCALSTVIIMPSFLILIFAKPLKAIPLIGPGSRG